MVKHRPEVVGVCASDCDVTPVTAIATATTSAASRRFMRASLIGVSEGFPALEGAEV